MPDHTDMDLADDGSVDVESYPIPKWLEGAWDEVSADDAKAKRLASELKKGGPYIGPRGGKWADPQHTRAWKPVVGGPRKTLKDMNLDELEEERRRLDAKHAREDKVIETARQHGATLAQWAFERALDGTYPTGDVDNELNSAAENMTQETVVQGVRLQLEDLTAEEEAGLLEVATDGLWDASEELYEKYADHPLMKGVSPEAKRGILDAMAQDGIKTFDGKVAWVRSKMPGVSDPEAFVGSMVRRLEKGTSMQCECGHKLDHTARSGVRKVRTPMVLVKADRVDIVCPRCKREVQVGVPAQTKPLRRAPMVVRPKR